MEFYIIDQYSKLKKRTRKGKTIEELTDIIQTVGYTQHQIVDDSCDGNITNEQYLRLNRKFQEIANTARDKIKELCIYRGY